MIDAVTGRYPFPYHQPDTRVARGAYYSHVAQCAECNDTPGLWARCSDGLALAQHYSRLRARDRDLFLSQAQD